MRRYLIGVTVVACSLAVASPTEVPAQQPQRGGVFRIGIRLRLAQRRELDIKKRRENILEIQRYLAAHPPYVKGFKHHDGDDLGRRLTFTWIER